MGFFEMIEFLGGAASITQRYLYLKESIERLNDEDLIDEFADLLKLKINDYADDEDEFQLLIAQRELNKREII